MFAQELDNTTQSRRLDQAPTPGKLALASVIRLTCVFSRWRATHRGREEIVPTGDSSGLARHLHTNTRILEVTTW